MAYRILLPQPIMESGRKYLEEKGYEIVDGEGYTEDDIIRQIPGCDAMIVRTAKITKKILDAADSLKVIARHGAGFDGVDLKAAEEKNVMVLYAPTANSNSVAETAIFYMLYCSRNFKKVQALYKTNYMTAKMKIEKHELGGKTLGLIGVGNIGGRVAKKAVFGFDMKVIAFDPYAKELPDYIQRVESREEVFKNADYVSLHIPATPETEKSVGAKEFDLMKPTAYLINTSRGALVDEPALIEALENHQIAGAGLDVQETEPPKADNPLYTLDNVILTPHMGWKGLETRQRLVSILAGNVKGFLEGTPVNVVS